MPFPEPPDPCSQAAGASHGGSRVESDGCHGAAGATSSEGDGTRSRRQAARRRSTPKMLRWQFEALSVVAVMLSVVLTAVQSMKCVVVLVEATDGVLEALFWVHFGFGVFFVLEYTVRVATTTALCSYMCSFWGFVDLLSGACAIGDIRCALTSQCLDWGTVAILAMVRAIRCIKLLRYLPEMNLFTMALAREFKGMLVLMLCMLVFAFVFGCFLFWAEGGRKGFESIPLAMWCAIVTMTTVGYGDAVPRSIMGRIVCAIFMLVGYSVLAVPTIIGILNMHWHDKESVRAAPLAVPSPSDAAGGLPALEASERGELHSGPQFALPREAKAGARAARESPPPELPTHLSSRRTQSPPYPEARLASAQGVDGGAPWRGAACHVRVRPRATDRDEFGCLRPGAYQQLMEEAVTEFFVATGAWTAHAGSNGSPSRPVMVDASFALARPAGRAAIVALVVALDRLDPQSCTFVVAAHGQEDDLLATGLLRHVWLCADTHREVDMPDSAYQCLKRRHCTGDA
uniref:Ion transport domain-containing protein n=1 Tax=Zooxanthella nutricula TaxID=1333877 RepID=A0A7S2VLR9_9DINO|mmetsp:Transcript_84292/g.257388  ORF Transcript_84292/g.257388 Transcript_84292/m.257388 type:complete len:516 (+) Transcript_84292:54-1601(+)